MTHHPAKTLNPLSTMTKTMTMTMTDQDPAYLSDSKLPGDDEDLAYLKDHSNIGSAAPLDVYGRCVVLKNVFPQAIIETASRSTTSVASFIAYVNKNDGDQALRALTNAISNADPDLIPAIERYVDLIARSESSTTPTVITAIALAKALSSVTTPTSADFGDQAAMLVNNVIAAYAACDNAAHLSKQITEDSIPFSMSNPLHLILHRLDPELNPAKYNAAAETLIVLLKIAMNNLLSKFSSSDAVVTQWRYMGEGTAISVSSHLAHENKNWCRLVNKLPCPPPEYERALNFINGFRERIQGEISASLAKKRIDSYSVTMDMVVTLARQAIDKLHASTSLMAKIGQDPTPLVSLTTQVPQTWAEKVKGSLPQAPQCYVGTCEVHPKERHLTEDCKAIQFELGCCGGWLYPLGSKPCENPGSCTFSHKLIDTKTLDPTCLKEAIAKAKARAAAKAQPSPARPTVCLPIITSCLPARQEFTLDRDRETLVLCDSWDYKPPIQPPAHN
jgi:hypothetical protein